MQVQKGFKGETAYGKYLVATLGNLEDMSIRMVNTLKRRLTGCIEDTSGFCCSSTLGLRPSRSVFTSTMPRKKIPVLLDMLQSGSDM